MWHRIGLGVVCSVGIVSGLVGEAALSAPVATSVQTAVPATDAQASAQATRLLAENPYEGRSDQQSLADSDKAKVDEVIKREGSRIKELAYATGRLSWRGVKAAAKFVRKVAGVGISFMAQIFKMVIFYCCFSATMAVVMPRVMTRI